MLMLSRLEGGTNTAPRSTVDLAQVLRREVEKQRPLADRRSQQLSVKAAAAAPIRANETQIAQLVANLLDNALKYTPAGGRIHCTCELRSGAGRNGDAGLPAQSAIWAVCEVADNGIGIAGSELPSVFDRFFRAHPEGNTPGTGLGLAIAQEIIRGHGGWIDVHSTLGQGSTFTAYLPLVEEDLSGA
jgi:signal transduction histidine kinase